MQIDAKTVKMLRDETDAPMMEAKKALVEAEGDFDKAKQILREKGQAQAAKRAGRDTSEGLALVSVSDDGKKVAGIIVECETDFVSRNEDFKKLVNDLLNGLMSGVDAPAGQVMEVDPGTSVAGKSLNDHMTDAVAIIRENIKLGAAVVGNAGDDMFAIYNHTNTGKKASFVTYSGDNTDAAGQIAMQTVAFPPAFLKRDEVPQDIIQAEIATETQRAINDGKPADVAEKIAQGRVNKEFYQSQVLLDQPLLTDSKKKVAEFAQESGIQIKAFKNLFVGSGSSE